MSIKFLKNGTNTDDATATVDDIINPKTAYVNEQKITGNIIPEYGISTLQTSGGVYSTDNTYDSYLFDKSIAIKLTGEGLIIGKIGSDNISRTKIIDKDTLGIDAIGTGASSFFPENVESDIIRILIISAPTNVGSRNYTAYVYKFNVNTFDIVLLNHLALSKIESSSRTIGRNWQEKIVWTDTSTCILPFSYAIGPMYQLVDLNFRYYKLKINNVNNIVLSVDKVFNLKNRGSQGDDRGGTIAGVNSVSKVDNYIVVFTSKNYAGNSDYNWNYSSIFINYVSDTITFISNGDNVGYIYHDSKVLGNNKIYDFNNLQNPIGDIAFNIPATKQILLDPNYVVAYNSNKLHIYKFLDDGNVEEQQDFTNFDSCNADASYNEYYIYSNSNLQMLTVQKKLNSLNKNGVFFRNNDLANVESSDILAGKIAYGRNGKLTGIMANNGELNYPVSTSEQIIPAGYTNGGTVSASPITKDDYNDCLKASANILWGVDFLPLSYIQSSGSQYIDTEVVPTNNTIVEMSVKKVGNIVDYERFFGIKDMFELIRSNKGNMKLKINNSEIGDIIVSTTAFTKLKFGKGNITLDDVSENSYSNSFATDKTAYIFFANGADRYGIIQLAYCKIWENDELIRYFIPAKDSNEAICLYDNISKKFYYNKGTGSFIGG